MRDPSSTTCIVGLRVYCQGGEARIWRVGEEGENKEDDSAKIDEDGKENEKGKEKETENAKAKEKEFVPKERREAAS